MAAATTVPAAPSPALAPPAGHPRFPLFDGLRGLLVLGILGFHVTEFTGRIGYGVGGRLAEVAGGEAVIGFFAISGFLLYRPFAAARVGGSARPSLRRYAERRALRILPGYWVILTLLAIYPGITGPFGHDWWRYYGYLQLYSAATEQQGIPVAWTLCVEVSFYVALPVWALLVSRLRIGDGVRGAVRGELLALGTLAAAGIAVQLLAAGRLIGYQVATSLAGQCTWIAIGMALAVASAAAERDERLLRGLRVVAGAAGRAWAVGLAAFVAMMAAVPSGGLFGLIAAVQSRADVGPAALKIALEVVLTSCLIAPLVFGEQQRGLPRRLLALRPLVWLGVVSYSFYLWHLTGVELLAVRRDPAAFSAGGWNLLGHVGWHPSVVLFVAALALTGLVATASYRLIELPFLRRKPRTA